MESNNNSHINASDKSSQHVSRDFKGIWIPREIWLHPELLPLEKILWAEIHSLFNREKGGCYASNSYFAKFFGVTERYIRDMMARLRSFGLLIEVSFDGRQRVIAALAPPEDLSPQVSSGQSGTTVPDSQEPQFRSGGRPSSAPSIIYSKDKNKEESVAPKGARTRTQKSSAAPPKKPDKAPPPDKTKYGEYVAMTPEHHSSRLAEYGADKLSWMIAYLDDKIGQNPQASKKWTSHYHVLSPRQWVHQEYEKQHNGDRIDASFSRQYTRVNTHANAEIAQNAKYKLDSSSCMMAIDEKNVIFIPTAGVDPEKTYLSLVDPNFEKRFNELLKRFGFK